jgi:hypothetical protein
MKVPRLTTRWLMILVGMIAVGLGAWRWISIRGERFHALSVFHLEIVMGMPGPRTPLQKLQAAYHWEMMGKYTKASERPWLPVEPDTPEPR